MHFPAFKSFLHFKLNGLHFNPIKGPPGVSYVLGKGERKFGHNFYLEEVKLFIPILVGLPYASCQNTGKPTSCDKEVE